MGRKNHLAGRIGGSGGGSRSSVYQSASRASAPAPHTAAYYAERAGERAENDDSTTEKEITDKIVRLLVTPDPEAQKEGQELLESERGNLDEARFEELTGQAPPPKKDNSLWGKAKGAGFRALEILGRPGQAAQEGLQATLDLTGLDTVAQRAMYSDDQIKAKNNLRSAHEAALAVGEEGSDEYEEAYANYVAAGMPEGKGVEAGYGESGGFGDVWKAVKGEERYDPVTRRDTKHLSYANALGLDTDDLDTSGGFSPGNLAINTASFVGEAALDPLNLVGGGAKNVAKPFQAKAAAKLAADAGGDAASEVLSKTLRKELARQGANEATEETILAALRKTGVRSGMTKTQRAAVRDSIEEGLESGPKALKPDSPLNPLRIGRGTRGGAARAADNQLTSALRYDGGGFRIASRTINPKRSLGLKTSTRQLGNDGAASAVMDGLAYKGAAAEDAIREGTEAADEAFSSLEQITGLDAATLREVPQDGLVANTAEALGEEAAEEVDELFTTAMNALKQVDDATDEAIAVAGVNTVDEALALDGSLGSATIPIRSTKTGGLRGVKQGLERAFSPRAKVRQSASLPDGSDVKVYQADVAGQGTAASEAKYGTNILRNAAKRLKKEGTELTDDVNREIVDALEMNRAPVGLSPAQQFYFDTLKTMKDRSKEILVEGGLADAAKLRDRYMNRVFSDEGIAALEKIRQQGGSLPKELSAFRKVSTAKSAGDQSGHLLARTIEPDMSLLAFNEKYSKMLQKRGFLDEGVDLMELDPTTLVAKRHNEVIKAQQMATTINEMQKNLTGALGEEIVRRVPPGMDPADAAKIAKESDGRGLTKINLGEAGDVYVHPDLEEHVTTFFNLAGDNQQINTFWKGYDTWMQMWKGYATVPIITGATGFHFKNGVGNMFNNYLAGVKNPAQYKRAMSIQNKLRKAAKQVDDSGIVPSPDDLLQRAGLSADEMYIVRSARENGVLDEGFFTRDLLERGEEVRSGIEEASTLSRVVGKFNPADPNGMWGIRAGRRVGEAVEDNARLTHYMSKLDELGDEKLAAASVKKFLFDYGDLTQLERKGMKRIMAFYTFTRKNTPLQLEQLLTNPAKIHRAGMVQQALLGESNPENVPEWMGELGRPLGEAQGGLLSNDPIVGTYETPFDAAMDTLSPLQALNPAGDKSFKDASAEFMGNASGGPLELGKLGFEEATGHKIFSGSSVYDSDGNRKESGALSIAGALMPQVSKVTRMFKEGDSRLKIAKHLTGLTGYEVTADRAEAAKKSRVYAIEDIIDVLEGKSTIDPETGDVIPLVIPTLGDLRKTGAVAPVQRESSGSRSLPWG